MTTDGALQATERFASVQGVRDALRDVHYLADDGIAGVAYLADKLPSAFAVEDIMLVQADLDFHDVIACCWGRDGPTTAAAVNAFTERYLDAFMEAAVKE